tara:strand:+ start:3855 stop:4037 length:183 start_codon:yes stop_codon:yes gene_type:complete
MENNYIITQDQLNNILKYMVTRPYHEVVNAITVLSKLPKLDAKINPDFVSAEGKKNDTKN